MGRLDGKVAIVTGGAAGIGRATGLRLAQEGAAVVIADLNADGGQRVADEIAATGARSLAVHTDIGKPEQVRHLVDRTVETFGHLDVLHNNAFRLYEGDRDFTTSTVEAWAGAIETNLLGHMLCCRYAVPHMIEQGGGSIINMASTVALGAGDQNVAYGVSKAAVIALTKFVATQHGKQGVRCNTIVTGFVLTRPEQRVPERVEVWFQNQHTARVGEPDDLAAVVAFLASDEARYVQAATIEVSGGALAHAPTTAQLRLQRRA
ncbi:MAG: SDR family oxidoreductase [Chloroflexi bacterium]|nr:SDR family oxidoreductase [Chloroflexota bacterium]